MLKIIKVNDRLAVGPQPDLSDFNELKSLGFGSVINNRPDGEGPSQHTADDASLKAEEAGLRYARQPIVLNAISEGDSVASRMMARKSTPSSSRRHERRNPTAVSRSRLHSSQNGRATGEMNPIVPRPLPSAKR